MTILKYVLMVLFVLVCIIATVLVLMQEGRISGTWRYRRCCRDLLG